MDASRILRDMDGARTKLNVLILDACRDNPFMVAGLTSTETGLAAMRPSGRSVQPGSRGSGPGLAGVNAPEGTVIAFATQPGNVAADGTGADSPYSVALEQAMRERGMNVLSMFNRVGVMVKRATGGVQQPWVSNSPIEGEYFFAGPGVGAVSISPPMISGTTVIPLPAARSVSLLERIAARAAVMSIPAPPPIKIYSRAADVPPDIARFFGAWGPGAWLGESESNFILLIDRVDAKGNAHVIRLTRGECDNVDCARRPPSVISSNGKIEAGVLSFIERPGWRYKFEVGMAGWLHGGNSASPAQERSSGPLTHIE